MTTRAILAALILSLPAPAVIADESDQKPSEPAQKAEPAKKAEPTQKADAAKKPAATPKKPVPPYEHVRVFANVAFTTGTEEFSQSQTFRLYAEDGQVDTSYKADSGVGFELGFHYRFKPRLGAMASVAVTSRDMSASYSAKVPHPFFLDRDREVSGTKDGLSYKQTAVHLDFVYTIPSGGLEVFFFAGPSFVDVKADLLTNISYTEAYPYDQVTVGTVAQSEQSDSGFGFNFGAGLDYRFGKARKLGIGAQLRYTTATMTLAPPEGPKIDVEGGGFQAAAGIRVFF